MHRMNLTICVCVCVPPPGGRTRRAEPPAGRAVLHGVLRGLAAPGVRAVAARERAGRRRRGRHARPAGVRVASHCVLLAPGVVLWRPSLPTSPMTTASSVWLLCMNNCAQVRLRVAAGLLGPAERDRELMEAIARTGRQEQLQQAGW